MSESPKVPLVSFLMLAMYAPLSSTQQKHFQPHFRLSELHQSDQGMLLNRFSQKFIEELFQFH